jgi:lipoprotein NlpI
MTSKVSALRRFVTIVGVAFIQLTLNSVARADFTQDWAVCLSGDVQSHTAATQIDACKRVVRANSFTGDRLAAAYFRLGVAQLRANQFDDAVESFTAAINLKPGYAKAHANRGLAYNGLEK